MWINQNKIQVKKTELSAEGDTLFCYGLTKRLNWCKVRSLIREADLGFSIDWEGSLQKQGERRHIPYPPSNISFDVLNQIKILMIIIIEPSLAIISGGGRSC